VSKSRTLLIIDDHAVVREGIGKICRAEFDCVISEAASLAEAIARCTQEKPDFVVVDINLPDGTGIEFIAWARSIDEGLPIVVLTLENSPDLLNTVMKSGANALVSKAAPLHDLISAIKAISDNPRGFISFGVSDSIRKSSLQKPISAREAGVLSQLARGGTIAEISSRLHISQSTLKTHIAHIYEKLEATDRTSALNRARELGLIDRVVS